MSTLSKALLLTLVVVILVTMSACDNGNKDCRAYDGTPITCPDYSQPTAQPVIEQAREAVEQVNNEVSAEVDEFVDTHNSGDYDCLSVWDQSCEDSGAYDN